MMESHRVFRNIDLRDRFFGFEFTDLILLAVIYSVATFFNKNGLIMNVAVTFFGALFLRVFKMNRPRGFMNDYFCFHFKKRRWSNGI